MKTFRSRPDPPRLFDVIRAGATPIPIWRRPGEAPITVRVATCAITGGFIHLYTALDNGLFDKYGMKVEFVSIRGSGVALAALAADEIQFLYCAADATIPGMAAGSDAKLIAAPLIGLPLGFTHAQRHQTARRVER